MYTFAEIIAELERVEKEMLFLEFHYAELEKALFVREFGFFNLNDIVLN